MAERLSSIRAHGGDGLEVHGQTERLPVKVLEFFYRHAGAVQQLEAALRLTPCMQWMTNEHLNERHVEWFMSVGHNPAKVKGACA